MFQADSNISVLSNRCNASRHLYLSASKNKAAAIDKHNEMPAVIRFYILGRVDEYTDSSSIPHRNLDFFLRNLTRN
jgi:hypothetical protein